MQDFDSKRVTVMGLGRFGGGAGATRWLAARGADVLVTDMQSPQDLAEPLAEIADLVERGAVNLRLGAHNVSDFTTCDLVIANPAVPKPWENRFLRAAQAAHVPVTTEIRLLTERINRQRVIGITGSAGKSTTTAMIHHILTRAGHRAHLGGNIGGSLLNSLHEIHHDDWVVLELSSAMLYWLDSSVGFDSAPGWSPHIAVLTNISPNHLDWHGSFEHYQTSKRSIFQHQRAGDLRVDAETIAGLSHTIPLKIPGAHNQFNAQLAAATVQKAAGISSRQSASLLADFPGLPHRLQLVAEREGVRFYNDSKSTTPEATMLAVRAFPDPATVHLIAGGYDKKIDLQPISSLASEIGGLYTIGVTGRALAESVTRGFAEYCGTLENAVERALARIEPGQILLLSPGCASWDQFTNYEQRGERFAQLVAAAPRCQTSVR